MFLPPESRACELPHHHPQSLAPAAVTAPRRGFFDRLDQWFWRQQQRDVEAYLARSVDVYDLETRIRALERSVSHSCL